jgi:N utilization substance protein A
MKPKDSNSRDEIRGALEAVAQAKNISIDTLLEALATAMLTAYKRLPDSEEYAIATIDPETFEIRIIAQELDEDFNVLREWDHTPNETFMQRVMAQTVKQVMSQRIREVERDQKYEDYAGREGQIVTGIVQQVDQRFTLLDLGKVEALLPSAEQVPHERFDRSARLKAYIVEVRKTTKGPQIVVSRTHPGLILRLFELEVPEIASGIVEIKACAREPGHRTKIAVYSHDGNVDPVGSCVGARGARVRMVTNELRGEKVDIVPFSEDPAEFVMRALQPAKVREVRLDDMTGVATVVVNDYQLSLAIGREGQNARLAGRLTGWEIQIKSESQLAEEEAGYAEGEWVEQDGEMLWQPADGGEALSAEAYYAEAAAEQTEPVTASDAEVAPEAVANEDVADLAPPVDDVTPEAEVNEDVADLAPPVDDVTPEAATNEDAVDLLDPGAADAAAADDEREA